MDVTCLLVSGDPQIQQTVADVFTEVDLRIRENTPSALQIIDRNHFDGFIIDCDGLECGTEVITSIRGSKVNRRSVVFTIVNGVTSVATATELGSNFVLGKPLDASRLQGYFRQSLAKMQSEHRRYFRYQLTLEATLIQRDGTVVPAQILNVSDGGLALRLLDRAQLHGSVTIRFTTPGTKSAIVRATAAISWSTEPIFGMQFTNMDEQSRSAYNEWLYSMALA